MSDFQQQIENEERRYNETKGVYAKIAAVMAEMSKVGISKDNYNKQQEYKFRGIDDVYNTLSCVLSRHGLVILPRALKHERHEGQTRSGGPLFMTILTVEYSIVSADDGSTHVCVVTGEAMDSGDKSTNKAMSAAYKYLCMQMFCIPTQGDNDADATTHDVAVIKPVSKPSIDVSGLQIMIKDDVNEAYRAYSRLDQETKKDVLRQLTPAEKDALKAAKEIIGG